jgi:hypothetical protein
MTFLLAHERLTLRPRDTACSLTNGAVQNRTLHVNRGSHDGFHSLEFRHT